MPVFKPRPAPEADETNRVKKKNVDPEKNPTPKKAKMPAFLQFLLHRTDLSRKFFGALYMLCSVFLALAFTSFLFSWKQDLSLSDMPFPEWLWAAPGTAANWMGMIGARAAVFFVYKGLGLAAFALPVFLFRMGAKYFLSRPFSVMLFLLRTIPLVIILSVSLALPFHTEWSLLAGGMAVEWLDILRGLFGWTGTSVLLILSVFSYLLLVYGFNAFEWLFRKKLNPQASKEVDQPVYAGETLFEKDRIELEEEENIEDEDDELTEDDLVLEIRNDSHEAHEEAGIELEIASSEPKAEMNLDPSPAIVPPLEIEPALPPESEETPPVIERQGIDTLYDPTLDLSSYKFPDIEFLKDYGDQNRSEVSAEDLDRSKNLIIETLKNYKIEIAKIKATIGPTVTLFEIVPAPGVKISKIKNLEDDIALSLAALGIRIIAPIPGKGTIGIEVPNKKREVVSMRSVIKSKAYQENDMDLPICLGKTISNEVFVADLAKMPHLLMAGATGQGKSVGLNALLVSLLYKKHPSELKFVLVDPKKVELTLYNTIERHFLAKIPGDAESIITDNKQVIHTLNSLTIEMDRRYELLQQAMVRNLKEYNHKFIHRKLNPNDGHRFLPYIVVVIDEVADLIMTAGKEVEHPIGRLAQLARAIGIHLVLATQRPSVNIITGTIKANFPARVAFRVTSKIDSRTILDASGADQLIGKGDMLYSDGNNIIRLQCPFVDTPEVEEITAFIGNQRGFGSAYILPEVEDDSGTGGHDDFDPDDRDALFEDAARIVVQTQQGSTSLLQRKLKIGYNRAGRLIDQLEHANIVGPFEGSKAREVLIRDEYTLEQYLKENL